VHQSITQMDETTQQNSALVEQTAAAAQTLRDQADALERVVSAFTIGAQQASYTPPARPAVRSAPVAKKLPPKPVVKAAAKPLASPVQKAKTTAAATSSGEWEEF
jgi:methyl-accepting chemotaxis protein